MYRNREVHPGESVMQVVTARDEWCAEAYMETDYSKLTQADFERVVQNYAIYRLLGNQTLGNQTSTAPRMRTMKRLVELFDVAYGHSLGLNRLVPLGREQGGVAFVSRTTTNNGISAYVAPIDGVPPTAAGLLTCALGGSVLSTFLQEEPFYSGYHIAVLTPRMPMTKQQLLFYCCCIQANRYRYNYGRQANRTLRHILLPALDELPDYVAQTDIARYGGCDRPALTSSPC